MIPDKLFFKIGEAAEIVGVEQHVLRYWEDEFDALRPVKNRAGQRLFKKQDVELILEIKRLLYEEKYTIEGARQRLLELRQAGELADERQSVLDPEVLAIMKEELEGLHQILDVTVPLEADSEDD